MEDKCKGCVRIDPEMRYKIEICPKCKQNTYEGCMVLRNGEKDMRSNTENKEIFEMDSEPSPELTADIVEKAISEIETESELAALFAVADNCSLLWKETVIETLIVGG